MRAILTAGLAVLSITSCRCDIDPLPPLVPHMKISPERVVINNAPVAQDTVIVFQVLNDARVDLTQFNAKLVAVDGESEAPVEFELREDFDDLVPLVTAEEVVVTVRPRVLGTIEALMIFTAEPDAEPSSRVEVPITVTGIDAGLPDICEYPESAGFGLVGRNSVATLPIRFENCGVRDLLVDNAFFCPTLAEGETADENGCGGDGAIAVANPTFVEGESFAVIPGGSMSITLSFLPDEVREYGGDLVIVTNDPDELEVRIPITGEGAQCPEAVAEFIDDPNEFEPFDIVGLTGENSLSATGAPSFVGRFEWRLVQTPGGSGAVPSPADDRITFIEADLAGRYVVQLEVFESVSDPDSGVVSEIRSCEPAQLTFDVVPDEELLVQLVWDHDTADLDLHMLREGGTVFTHEGDVYFSNREPEPEAPWSTNPDENPTLDVDDDEGYGPENMSIVRPAPGSCWRTFVHYWNAQTPGETRAEATVRVFVYGVQTMEISRVFEEDEQLWQALEICWPDVEGDPASISQLGVVEPFARPF